MSKKDKHEQHRKIARQHKEITEEYLKTNSKKLTAEKFGISPGGVDSALGLSGMWNLTGSHYRKRFGPKETPPTTPLTKKEHQPIPQLNGSTSKDIAAELLKQTFQAVADHNSLLSEKNNWRDRALKAEESLKKATEEKDRVLRVHNEAVKQSNGTLPTVESIVAQLRRETGGRI